MRLFRALMLVVVPTLALTGAAQGKAQITRIEFRPATVQEGGGVVIALIGTGRCTYTIDFGDGQKERRTADLPDEMRHAYGGDAEYEVIATPEAPCEGVARAKIDVRAVSRGIWRLFAELNSPTAPEIIVTVDGRGECAIVVDFGDGQKEKHSVTLPAKIPHKYLKGGAYEISATTQDPCRGEGRVRIEIKSER